MNNMNKQQQAAIALQREKEYNDQLQEVRFIRHYTLEAENLQKPYDEYVEAQRLKNQKAMEEYQEMLKKVSEDQKLKAEIKDAPFEPDTIESVPYEEVKNN